MGAMFDHLADDAAAMIFAKDRSGRYVFVNRGYELAYRVSRDSLLGKTDDELFPKEKAAAFRAADKRVLDSKLATVVEERSSHGDGQQTVLVVKFPYYSPSGELAGVCGVATDVTQRAEGQARLRMLSEAVDQATDMIAIFELNALLEWRIAYVNQTFLRMTGYERADVIGRTSHFLDGPRTDREESNRRRAMLARGMAVRAEVPYYRRDGSVFWVELNARPLRDPDGAITHTIVLYRDVSERTFIEDQHALEVVKDERSGLYNRRYLSRALEQAMHDARVNERPHGLLFVSLCGSSDLMPAARAVEQRLRSADVLARVGSDELAVLLRLCSLQQAQRVAREFIDVIAAIGNPANIGVTEIDGTLAEAAGYLARAEEACRDAARTGPNRIAL